jgi:hypothetical protein
MRFCALTNSGAPTQLIKIFQLGDGGVEHPLWQNMPSRITVWPPTPQQPSCSSSRALCQPCCPCCSALTGGMYPTMHFNITHNPLPMLCLLRTILLYNLLHSGNDVLTSRRLSGTKSLLQLLLHFLQGQVLVVGFAFAIQS